MKITSIFTLLFLCSVFHLKAQPSELPYKPIVLNDLGSFEPATSNWKVAGDVFMDLYKHHGVQAEAGKGVLVNTNEGDDRQDIYTRWAHGDLDLELEFMMARESNSGIYFQGRYELQLMDSWGVENPKFSDVGGIYQWWEEGTGVGGIAPRVNAARAPGLWQHLKVQFRAPRFNGQGEKVANARLEEVILNGVVIHENIELIHPTGGAVSNKEVRMGPLRFQGDHGPIAFRNIRYKIYNNAPVQLDNISYRYFEGEFENVSDFEQQKPLAEGEMSALSLKPRDTYNKFSFMYEGNIQIKEAGEYLFELQTEGGNRLIVNGEELIETGVNNQSQNAQRAIITLSEGIHSFELTYYKDVIWTQPALGLYVEGPGIARHPLPVESALPVSDRNATKIINPDGEPLLMHGFMDMGGRVHPHSAAVGYPGGIHYAFDLNTGSLLRLWKGAFLNVSPMWEGRGGGNLTPAVGEAAAIPLSGAPSLAYLESDDDSWPDSLQQELRYVFNNYRFEEDGGVVFNYQLNDLSVEDRIIPAHERRELSRTLTFQNADSKPRLFARLVEGQQIAALPNGLYQVEDKTFYISLAKENDVHARIRATDKGQELVVPVPDEQESTLTYSLIW